MGKLICCKYLTVSHHKILIEYWLNIWRHWYQFLLLYISIRVFLKCLYNFCGYYFTVCASCILCILWTIMLNKTIWISESESEYICTEHILMLKNVALLQYVGKNMQYFSSAYFAKNWCFICYELCMQQQVANQLILRVKEKCATGRQCVNQLAIHIT